MRTVDFCPGVLHAVTEPTLMANSYGKVSGADDTCPKPRIFLCRLRSAQLARSYQLQVLFAIVIETLGEID